MRLPGQRPGAGPQAAAPAGEVSQLQEALAQRYGAGAWADVSRNTYLRYRTATRPGLIRSDRKNGASWVHSTSHRLQYTTAGEIQSDSTDQYLDAPFGPYAALVGTFNSPSQVRRELQTIRIPTPGGAAPWDSLTRHTHTYNAAGQRTQVLDELYFIDEFQPSGRRRWTYNAQGQITVFERQSAPSSGPDWEPLQRQTYTYNVAGHVQQVISELAFASPTYLNTSRNTMQFDAQGRESVLTTDMWENNAWQLYSQTLYAYNATGDLASATAQLWDGSTFQNAQRLLLTYAQVLGARPAATGQPLAVVPNPSAAEAPAHLQFAPGTTAATGAVYDHLGRRVAELTGAPAQAARGFLPLPASLPAGLYVVRLQAGARQWQARWDKR